MTFHACRTRSTFSRLFWEFDLSLLQPFSIISRLPTVASSSHVKAVAPFKGVNLLVESGILGFQIRNTAQGIRNPTNDWNPIQFSLLTWNKKQTIFVLTGPFFVKFHTNVTHWLLLHLLLPFFFFNNKFNLAPRSLVFFGVFNKRSGYEINNKLISEQLNLVRKAN